MVAFKLTENIFKKQELEERRSSLMLEETSMVSDLWKKYCKNADDISQIKLEQAVWLTLAIEWGLDSEIYFNYEESKVQCLNKRLGLEKII